MKAKRLLIVDGYNVIHGVQKYKNLIDHKPDIDDIYMKAREALITDVAVAAQGRYAATVVFDGAGNVNSQGEPYMQAGIRIIFSAYKHSADSVIEKIIHQARARGEKVYIVSSDATIQNVAMGEGVERLSARMFDLEMENVNESWKTKASQVHKTTVAQSINPDIAARLCAFVRGESDTL